MHYEEFVKHLVTMSEQSEEVVRAVLFSIPDALSLLNEDETLRTPLGTFRVVTRKPRMMAPPNSDQAFPVVAETTVKLKSGLRLRWRQKD